MRAPTSIDGGEKRRKLSGSHPAGARAVFGGLRRLVYFSGGRYKLAIAVEVALCRGLETARRRGQST